MYDKITEEKKNISNKFWWKNITCEKQNFYILLDFLLITIALLIAFSIYCYLIKYWGKQKPLTSFHITNNELREIWY